MRIARVLVIACLLASGALHAQQAWVPIEQRLSAAQLRDTGLDQLTPAQLALLNDLLREERSQAMDAARNAGRDAAVREAPPAREPVDSRIVGAFRGWQPGTVLSLENGQQWRVLEGELNIRAMPSPRASVRPGMVGAWYLRVEGQTPTAKVTRVR